MWAARSSSSCGEPSASTSVSSSERPLVSLMSCVRKDVRRRTSSLLFIEQQDQLLGAHVRVRRGVPGAVAVLDRLQPRQIVLTDAGDLRERAPLLGHAGLDLGIGHEGLARAVVMVAAELLAALLARRRIVEVVQLGVGQAPQYAALLLPDVMQAA